MMDNQPPTKRMPTLHDIDAWRQSHGHNKVVRAVAWLIGVVGILAMLALGVAWIMGVAHILNNGQLLGYFQGAPAALTALFYSCAFYAVFMPLQVIVAWAFNFAANRHGKTRYFAALLLWLCALAGIAIIIAMSPPISQDVQALWNNYQQTGNIGG